MSNILPNDLLQAVGISGSTLVGHFGNKSESNFDANDGNCFSVHIEGGKSFHIVNFYLEPLEYLLSIGLTWPIQIKVIDNDSAFIHDTRISNKRYATRWCEGCTPKHLLPMYQVLAQEREKLLGRRIEREDGSVTTIYMQVTQF